MSKRWTPRYYDANIVDNLSKRARIPAILAQLFVGRGLISPDEVKEFMDSKLVMLRQPQELPGCVDLARKLLDAIKAGRKITVYGDYDVDGMTGTAILTRAAKLLGGNVNYYVPSRLDEGYGLNNDAIKTLAEDGTQLIITVDCGISSCEEAETAKNLGIELLITDHHTPGPVLPDASAIAHPQLVKYENKLHSPNSQLILELSEEERAKVIAYPFPELSGATVGLKVAWAIGVLESGGEKVSPRFRSFLLQAIGFATLGTIADVVPLIDENRVLVKYGLQTVLVNNVPIGLEELYRAAKISTDKEITSETVGFQIAPRLNATGRLGQAQLGIELLLTDQLDRAKELAEYINGLNETRQKLERAILKEASRQITELYDPDDAAYVLACPDWHSGVIGIISGRLSEQYHKPVIMISQDKMGLKPATGSARSVPGFNLYNALESCRDYLVRFGGHASAAGLGIMDDRIDSFRQAFCDYVAENTTEEMKTAEILIDGEFPLGVFTLQVASQIEEMAPFGAANRRPIMCSQGVYLSEAPKTMGVDNRHFSANFQQDNVAFRAISFGNGQWVEKMAPHGAGPFDIVFHVTLNTFGGRTKVELNLIDWQPSK